jgi:hypothetical protein
VENKPEVGYYVTKNKMFKKNWYDEQNAKKMYEDYPKVKLQRDIVIVIAVIELIATILLGYQQLKGG